jgi:hypothetical protein
MAWADTFVIDPRPSLANHATVDTGPNCAVVRHPLRPEALFAEQLGHDFD